MIDMQPTRTEPTTRRGPSRWAALVTALALFAGGVGVGWLFTAPSETPEAASEITIAAPTTTTLAPSTGAPPGDPGEPASTEPLISTTGDEPVADIAEALLGAIVQINLPGHGVGSGVIYASDGKILTAAHVVDGFDQVEVRLSNGETVPGIVLGSDSPNDIALVEIDRQGLPAAPLALDAKPRVGQLAVALGSPWGLDSSVTAGIVSAVDRALPDGDTFRSMLQTDASINPGNSGGALADRDGRVIGINVSIFSSSGANDGVGFAVPIGRAYRVAQALAAGREFVPGFLGVTVQASETGSAGAIVTEIAPDSSAALAGMKVGDVVVFVEDVPIADLGDLVAQVVAHEAGDIIAIDILRDGDPFTLQATLGGRP